MEDDTLRKVGEAREGRLGRLPQGPEPEPERPPTPAEVEQRIAPLAGPPTRVLFIGGTLNAQQMDRPSVNARAPFRFFHGLVEEKKLVFIETWEWNEELGAMLLVKGELKHEAECEVKPRWPTQIVQAKMVPPGAAQALQGRPIASPRPRRSFDG